MMPRRARRRSPRSASPCGRDGDAVPVDINEIADDLQAETDQLDKLLAGLSDADWDKATPAEGWMVRDQISHLAHFDPVTIQSAPDPEAFRAYIATVTDVDALTADVAAKYRHMPAFEMLEWFRQSRSRMIEVFRGLDPSMRVPWYGPPMSAASSLTARIMETWAHGQDVADTIGQQRQ